jgi:uncharacterized protein YjbJ (UPF0337 family)
MKLMESRGKEAHVMKSGLLVGILSSLQIADLKRKIFQHQERRSIVKNSTKDQAEGKFHELKGKVKEKVGQAVNKPDLEAEGQDEKLAGKVQKKVGQIEKVFEK